MCVSFMAVVFGILECLQLDKGLFRSEQGCHSLQIHSKTGDFVLVYSVFP